MTDINQNMSDVLGVPYEEETPNVPVVVKEQSPVIIQPAADTQQRDIDFSRSNYYELLEKGNEALDGIMRVAKESQHPRAYEVAANMLKNLADMTDKLMILQKQKKELSGEGGEQTRVNVEKAVFVGSTADLLKQVRSQ